MFETENTKEQENASLSFAVPTKGGGESFNDLRVLIREAKLRVIEITALYHWQCVRTSVDGFNVSTRITCKEFKVP